MVDDGAGGGRAADTALRRTYRYLRLGVAATVVAIAVAVTLESRRGGLLESISAYYYTPARDVLVGALIAGSLGLLALSGRGVQRALLDAAALLAPLVAVVPTPTLGSGCGATACVPASAHLSVDNGVATYLVVGALAVVVAVVVGTRADAGQAALARTWPSIALAVAVLTATWAWWGLARTSFLGFGHLVAATGFFALLAAVALIDAGRSDWAPEQPPARGVRVAYAVVGVLLAVDLTVVISVVAIMGDAAMRTPLVFVGEVVALVLFGLYWVLQTVGTWSSADPRLAVSGPGRPRR
ncbi:hypothetical protein NQ156_02455 [Microbacterium sp. zg.Y625]|uniref:hypothetical protein n=1 Tax=Microbacterium jiangjiandongii TaxID=3049071 RepID=UPI00214B6981|nr:MULTISPECIES: hypothetical protein [unclassified Microbacterium]MCR2791919.1 hypothetical protein [Microbacterium sp. zg.Y625]WIM24731.1 hypothetical protein QNO14_11365 [Microbacterium sp. zg-Y625]